MKLVIDEQMLTAYALGELSGEMKKQVEAYLAEHPEAAAEVESIRATAGLLTAQLAAETAAVGELPRPTLTAAPLKIKRTRRVEAMLAMAASVALVAGSVTVMIRVASNDRRDSQALQIGTVTTHGIHALQPTTQPALVGAFVDPSFSLSQGPVVHKDGGTGGSGEGLFRGSASPAEDFDLLKKSRDQLEASADLTLNGMPRSKNATGGPPTGKPAPAPVVAAGASNRTTTLNLSGSTSTYAGGMVVTAGAGVAEPPGGSKPAAVLTSGTINGTWVITPKEKLRLDTVTESASKAAIQGRLDDLQQKRKVLEARGIAPDNSAVLKQLDDQEKGLRRQLVQPDAPDQTGNESYNHLIENEFLSAAQDPLSTFSIDVDTASYSNIRRFLTQGQMPPKDAVRIEEMVNYFPYKYEGPKENDKPFAANVEVAGCPWNAQHRLVRVGIKGKEIAAGERPASNLVFLIDVSGSMNEPNKLPLVKESLRKLVNKLDARDRVAIVVYAGSSGLVLPSTKVEVNEADKAIGKLRAQLNELQSKPLGTLTIDQAKDQITDIEQKIKVLENGDYSRSGRGQILAAIDHLEAGGSTNGGAGIELAYSTAASAFIKDGTNRVILATDGDWNVGVTDQGDLTRLIEEKAKGGTFLSVLGFGMGNLKDSTMEKLADKGNGNYAYIDTEKEAQKVLVEQMSGTLVTIAKDVKIQVEFNPAKVGSYRLIGYEKRLLAKEDFNNDKKDAGEIGAGHTITALYEVALPGDKTATPGVDPLKYQKPTVSGERSEPASNDLLTLKIRYKAPDAPLEQGTSKLLEFPVKDDGKSYQKASEDFKFAAAVASFGMVIRDSEFKGTANLNGVIELAQEGVGQDMNGYRAEFIEMAKKAKELSGK